MAFFTIYYSPHSKAGKHTILYHSANKAVCLRPGLSVRRPFFLFFFSFSAHTVLQTHKHALHKAAKCRERLFPCPRDGNFSIFTAGPVALAASCHVIRLSPRGLDQTPVVSRLGGEVWRWRGWGVDLSLTAFCHNKHANTCVYARQRDACTVPFLPFKLSLSEEQLRKNK